MARNDKAQEAVKPAALFGKIARSGLEQFDGVDDLIAAERAAGDGGPQSPLSDGLREVIAARDAAADQVLLAEERLSQVAAEAGMLKWLSGGRTSSRNSGRGFSFPRPEKRKAGPSACASSQA